MYFLKRLSKTIFSNHRPLMLGRWSLDKKKNLALVIDYSNEDHCGNCGDYLKSKQNERKDYLKR